MELENKCSATGQVEDSETISNSNSEELGGDANENKVAGFKDLAKEHNDESIETEGKGIEVTEEAMNSPAVVLEVKSTPSPTTKGYGLKKWRRIKREMRKDVDSNIDSSELIMKRGLSNSGKNSVKSAHYSTGTSQQSKGTISSINDHVRNPDVIGNSVAAHGFMAEEDQSSESSTAASAPNMRNKKPAVEYAFNRSLVNLSQNNSGSSVQKGQQRKGRIESSKKPRGESVTIEKENSHSSLESDSRSSNFVFMQGTSSLKSNGTNGGRPLSFDGENGDEDQDCEGKVGDDLRASNNDGNSRQFEDVLQEDLAAESSWESKDEKSVNDPVIESLFTLQAAQEALEREVQKFKEIAKEAEVNEVESIISHRPSVGGRGITMEFSIDMETELENLFKQKIETEVEFLVSKAAAADHVTVLEEQKALASEQAQMVNKLRDAEEKAKILKKEAEKLEDYCKNMVSTADDTLKIQKSVFKHSFCFFSQLILLVIVIGLFILQLSPHHHAEVVPT